MKANSRASLAEANTGHSEGRAQPRGSADRVLLGTSTQLQATKASRKRSSPSGGPTDGSVGLRTLGPLNNLTEIANDVYLECLRIEPAICQEGKIHTMRERTVEIKKKIRVSLKNTNN